MADSYKTFFKTHGRSYRTKHIVLRRAHPLLRWIDVVWTGPAWAIRRNCRPFYLPAPGPVPPPSKPRRAARRRCGFRRR